MNINNNTTNNNTTNNNSNHFNLQIYLNETCKDADKTLLTSAIKTIGKKNIQQIFEWQKKYPEYNDPSSRQNDKYLKMLCNAMNGSTDDEQEKNMDKIIRNITKEVIIDKNIVC